VNLSYDQSITLPPSSLQRKEIVGVEIFADRSKISQVLRNFISNALKFTPTGGHVSIVQKFIPHIANSSGDAIISDNRLSSMVREVRSRVSSSAVFVTNVEVDDIESDANTTPNGTLRVEVHDTGHGISRVRPPPLPLPLSLLLPSSISSGKSRKTFQVGHSIRYGGSPRRQGLRLGFI
jgi:signal transduction histidine kinase